MADPANDRYLRLSVVGLPIECPSCGASCLLSAKARGMGAGSWEACCTACSQFTWLNGYAHPGAYDDIIAVEERFLRDGLDDSWRQRMVEIAATVDERLQARTCRCGAPFSVAAAPRCPGCRRTLMDSFFHVAYAAPGGD